MLFRHSGIYILAKLIPGLMAFAALSLYTHLLTPSEYGVYTLILTGTVFIHNVVFNWLSSGTLRYWSNQEYNDSQFINTLSTSFLRISSVLLVLALIATAYFWGKPESIWVIASFSLLIALALFTITQNLFSAKIEPASYAFLTICYSIFSLSLGGLFSYMGYGATGVIIGIALGTSIPALFVFKKLWLPYKKSDFNKPLFKRL